MAKYQILVEAVINQAQLQQQLNTVKPVKPVTIPITATLNTAKIENQIALWENSLEKMRAKSPDAFSDPRVQQQVGQFKSLFETFKQGKVSASEMRLQLDNVRTSLATVSGEMRNTNADGLKLSNMFELALKKILIWTAGTTLLFGAIHQIRDAVQYIKDLNKEMTNIQIVTGATDVEIRQLAASYNDLAYEMGATTLEVARGSLEWARQGKTVKETQELLKTTLMMSKLGNMEAAQATEYLTSMLNGFNLEAEESVGILDKLVVLDNSYATSVAEIAEGLKRSSNSAQQAGVTFDELASYITIVSSVTRKSAESIGESFKTMFARMENIKLGKMFEDETTNINDVEKALSLVNIKIRDTETSFRPMGDVFDEVAEKWDTMNELEQSAVANAIAGVRQRENFLTLMRNYNEVLAAQQKETEAAGLSQERYKIYLDNVEAATNRLTAAWEKLVSTTTNSDIVKFFIDLSTGIIKAVDAVGLFNIALVALSGITFSKLLLQIPYLTNLIANLTGGFGVATLGVTKFATSITGLLVGVAFALLINAVNNANNAMTNLYDTFSKSEKSVQDNQKELTGLASEYEKLANKTNKTLEEETRLLDIQTILNTKYGALSSGVTAYSDAMSNNTDKIKENIQWMKNLASQQESNFIENNKGKYEEAQKYLGTANRQLFMFAPQMGFATPEDAIKIYDQIIAKGGDITGAYKWQRDLLVEQVEAAQDLIIKYEHFLNLQKTSVASNSDDITESLRSKKPKTYTDLVDYDELIQKLSAMQDKMASVNNTMLDLISNYEKYGEVGLEEIGKLREAFGDEYIDALYVENGQIKLNVEALKELMIARARDALAIAEQILQGDQYNENLIKQRDIAKAYLESLESGAFFVIESVEKAKENLLKMTISMLKQQKENEKEQLRQELANYKEMIDGKIDALEELAAKEKQELQDQLDRYKAIIEAEIRLIDKKRDAEKHSDVVAEKNKEIANIDAQLLALQFDNSEAANAKRLELENERAKKVKELSNIQTEYSIENQKKALTEELELFETENKKKQEIIERNLESQKKALENEYKLFESNIEAKIQAIENYLSQAGTINAEAQALLSSRTAEFYNSLMEWNRIYGENVQQNVIDTWLNALGIISSTSMGNFSFPSFGSGNSLEGGWAGAGGGYHDGGIVGGKPGIKETEVFAKLLKGEVVGTESQIYQFMNKTLPALRTGDQEKINMPISIKVMGNLDKSVLPDLKDMMLDVVNSALKNKGVRRDAFSFSV